MAGSRIGVCVHGVALNTWCERCPSGKRYQITVSGTTASNTQETPEPTQQAADEPRAIVRAFALLGMERKLAANDGVKGGWKKAHWFNLYRCMVMEKAELLNALEALDSVLAKLAAFDDRFEGGELLSRIDADEDELLRQLDTAKRDVLQEAADVSNYAMMIADVCGALPPTDERGR